MDVLGSGSLQTEFETRRATIQFARMLASVVREGDLIILKGELGSGKTFFTRALCRALGVPASVTITSPTFTLVHEHHGRIQIGHADLYRLKSDRELLELGLRDMRSHALLVVEWGERFADALGGDALTIELQHVPESEHRRRILLGASGERSLAILEHMK